MADDLDDEHQPGHCPNRSKELLDITCAMLPDSIKVIVDKGCNSATKRHAWVGGRRFKSRNQSEQIAKQNKVSKGKEIGQMPLIVMPDDLLRLLSHELLGHFHGHLQLAGFFY